MENWYLVFKRKSYTLVVLITIIMSKNHLHFKPLRSSTFSFMVMVISLLCWGFYFMKNWQNLIPYDLKGEIWVDVLNFEGHFKISNKCRIKALSRKVECKNGFRTKRERICKQYVNREGYLTVSFRKKGVKKRIWMVHVLLALHFIPNPKNKPQVHHIDDNPTNPCLYNLKWVTGKENMEYAAKRGRMRRGEKQFMSKLKEAEVLDIYETDMPYRKMAALFNVSFSAIQLIKSNANWKYLTKNATSNIKNKLSTRVGGV